MSNTYSYTLPQGASTPLAERAPRWIHAIILLVTSGLTVMVTAVLGPSLPAMQAHFAGVSGVDFLVPLAMSAPMLMMAFVSIFAGELADRVGRKKLLVRATLLYALVGTAPLYLDSLTVIIASRFALGILEAVLMTVSTVLIGDYYPDGKRERFMSLQTTVAASTAFLFNNAGGLLAELGWRAPYAVFSISLLLAPLMIVFLWEPKSRATMDTKEIANEAHPFRLGPLVLTCVLAVLTGIMFLTVPVHLGYLFGAIGVQSPARIGMAYGINSLGVISGTLLFGWVLARRLQVGIQVAAGALIAGLGFLLMQTAGDYTLLTAAGLLNGFGAGILLPTMVTWNMRILPLSRRGVGTGAFQSSLFLGMFVNPLLVVWLEKSMHAPRADVIGWIGDALVVLAVIGAIAHYVAGRRRTAGGCDSFGGL